MTTRCPVSSGVRIALVVLGLLIALWLLVPLRSIVLLLLIALTLATGIHPVVKWLHARALPPDGWHLPRWLAILTTLLAIVAAVLGPIAAGMVAVPLAFLTMPLWVGIVVAVFFAIIAQARFIQCHHELLPFR